MLRMCCYFCVKTGLSVSLFGYSEPYIPEGEESPDSIIPARINILPEKIRFLGFKQSC